MEEPPRQPAPGDATPQPPATPPSVALPVGQDIVHRPPDRRRAVALANIQKAIAWRRSPEGNASASLNHLAHGLRSRKGLLWRLGESPEDFQQHQERLRRIFPSKTDRQRRVVERLARATWQRMSLLRARARFEQLAWQKLDAKAGQGKRVSAEGFVERAVAVSRFLFRGHPMENASINLEFRIERLLNSLLRARGFRLRL